MQSNLQEKLNNAMYRPVVVFVFTHTSQSVYVVDGGLASIDMPLSQSAIYGRMIWTMTLFFLVSTLK